MLELAFVIIAIALVIALIIVLIAVLGNGKFDLHIGTDKKKDVLHIETKHLRHKDK